ncbi:MAG: cupin domain-containing protein [Planctomycetota bacterium]
MQIRSWKHHPDFPASEDSHFRGCWEYELKAGENTIPHQHQDDHEINIPLEGNGHITVGELTRDLQPGEVVFIPARTSHYIENSSSALLRGISIESSASGLAGVMNREPVTVGDLDQIVTTIPGQLNETESLQLIIRLFDLAGYLSEQIESAIGLDNETGYETLQLIEKKVMAAVVEISNTYQGGDISSFFPRRF